MGILKDIFTHPVYAEGMIGDAIEGEPQPEAEGYAFDPDRFKIDAHNLVAAEADDPAVQQQHRQAAQDHNRSLWEKRALDAGVDPMAMHQLGAEILAHDKAFKRDQRKILDHAQRLGRAFGYGDMADGNGVDDVAGRMTEVYPDHFTSPEEAAEQLRELLLAGHPELMNEDQAYQQAFDHLVAAVAITRHQEQVARAERIKAEAALMNAQAELNGGGGPTAFQHAGEPAYVDRLAKLEADVQLLSDMLEKPA